MAAYSRVYDSRHLQADCKELDQRVMSKEKRESLGK